MTCLAIFFQMQSLKALLVVELFLVSYLQLFWIENKINDQDELIKELSSRLEDCEEKNAKNHELKK